MTGGMAFVFDETGDFDSKVNPESVVVNPVANAFWEQKLLSLIAEHERETGSALAAEMLRDWERYRARFRQVCPREMLSRLEAPLEAVA
jgi:glutamate synthase (NADPH/NADH) large chain